MKRLILLVWALAAWTGCAGGGGRFVVNGTVDAPNKGRAYLLVSRGDVTDTLATDTIVDGRFTLTGSVADVELVRIVVDGMWGSAPLFAENGATFEVAMGNMMSVTGGGAAQQLDARFAAIRDEGSKKKAASNAEYFGALQSGDTAAVARIDRQFEAISAEAANRELALIREYPDEYVSAYYVYLAADDMGFEALKERYEALGERGRAFPTAAVVGEMIAALGKVAAGQTAPDFTLATPDGGSVSLYGTKAEVRLIDFWASWCGPCRKENPHLVGLYEKFHPKGLEIIGVSLDNDTGKWKQAIAEDSLMWLHGSDLGGWGSELIETYMVNAIPHVVLVDRDNRIIASGLRGNDLRRMLEKLLP